MDQSISGSAQSNSSKPPVDSGQKGLSTWVVILVIIIFLVIIAIIYYFWLKPNKPTTTTTTTTPTATTETGDSETKDVKTTQKIASDFENAVMENDNTTIESLLADKVNLVEEATECCGDVTAKEVMQQLNYLKDTKTLDFFQGQDIVKKIKAKYPKLQDYALGIDDSKEVFGYHLNLENKVDKIYMSITYEILEL